MNEPIRMPPAEVLAELPVSAWQGPFDASLQERARAALEGGKVLYFPALAFRPTEEELPLLKQDAAGAARKNISLDPAQGAAQNLSLTGDEAARLAAMMERFGRGAARLLSDLLPGYAPHLERARTSFRPVEIAGRHYSPRHDDRLLHVDAFPSRPMRGRRILRLFSNIAPDGAPRAWRVGEDFARYAARFAPKVRPALPGSARLLQLAGLTKSRRSGYDHLMLGLHDLGKFDAAWQVVSPRAEVSFPAGSTWACFTDQVLHAALAGHCALEQTFYLPIEAMGDPASAPVRVLERMTGRALV